MPRAQILMTLGVLSLATALTRVLPFLLFPGSKKPPEFVQYLGKVLPFPVIGMLVVYCFRNVSFSSYPFGIPELAGLLYVVLVHRWKHNLLLSIVGGAAFYVLLSRVL